MTSVASSRAFTLIEVLLGLLIFSIIAAGLYGTFRSGLDISRRTEKVNSGYREIRWIFDQMAKDFDNAIYYDLSGSYPDMKIFEGAPDHVRLIVAGKNGLRAVQYELAEPDAQGTITTIVNRKAVKKLESYVISSKELNNKKVFIRTEKPLAEFFSKGISAEDGEVLSFLVKEDGLKFSYAQSLDNNETEIPWRTQWNKDFIPSAVKVELTTVDFESGAGEFSSVREFWIPVGASTEK